MNAGFATAIWICTQSRVHQLLRWSHSLLLGLAQIQVENGGENMVGKLTLSDTPGMVPHGELESSIYLTNVCLSGMNI